MIEILQNYIATLKADATLTAIVPSANILTGPVDILSEGNSDKGLVLPVIVLTTVAESQRARPTYTRDTVVGIDIFSKNSQLELETIYERVLFDLNYFGPYTQGSATVAWQLLDNSHDVIESDRRIWHKAVSVRVWAYKPTGSVY